MFLLRSGKEGKKEEEKNRFVLSAPDHGLQTGEPPLHSEVPLPIIIPLEGASNHTCTLVKDLWQEAAYTKQQKTETNLRLNNKNYSKGLKHERRAPPANGTSKQQVLISIFCAQDNLRGKEERKVYD